MGIPTKDDPLGQIPTPFEAMTEAFGAMVRKEIDDAWRGRTGRDLHGVPDAVLCMELIARGWVVYKPAPPKD